MKSGGYQGAMETLLQTLAANPYNKDVAQEEADAAKMARAMELKIEADAPVESKDYGGVRRGGATESTEGHAG
eukprot:SAG11_NODE_986_length_6284_cov_72.758771_10_plen_73_part_00